MVLIIKKGTSIKEIRLRLEKFRSKKKGKNINAFAGRLKIKLDPVEWQNIVRSEWQ